MPKEICKRVPRNHVKTVKEMLRVPKPKDDSKPRIRVEKARIDPQLEKKQANIARLKQQLAIHLKELRMIELKEMPFDSSKVKFHDKMDMFFRINEQERPNRTLTPSKKRPVVHEKKSDKVNDYINAYEQRKKE